MLTKFSFAELSLFILALLALGIGRVSFGEWEIVESPTTKSLYTVFANSPTDVWVGGSKGIILHYDGVSWDSVPSPTTNSISSIRFLSSSNGWGIAGNKILRFNGVNWQAYSSADPYNTYLYDFGFPSRADTDIWFVGESGTVARYDTIANDSVYYDTTYRATPGMSLNAVDFISPDIGYAVGKCEWIVRFNGTSWDSVYSSPGIYKWLAGICLTSDSSGWAVGGEWHDIGTILRLNGLVWEDYPCPVSFPLQSVSFVSPSDGWIVGGNTWPVNQGVALHFNGTSWDTVSLPPDTKWLLFCHFLSTGEGWAVGDSGCILHYTSSGIEEREKLKVKGKKLEVWPNPFYQVASIRYHAPRKNKVSLKIYDVVGKLVRTLIDEQKLGGEHTAEWDGQDNKSKKVKSGIYFCCLTVNKKHYFKKVIFLKGG